MYISSISRSDSLQKTRGNGTHDLCVSLYTSHKPIHYSPRACPRPRPRPRPRLRPRPRPRSRPRVRQFQRPRARVPAPPHPHLHLSSPPPALAFPAAAPTPVPHPHFRTPFPLSWRTSPRSHQLEHACPANARLRTRRLVLDAHQARDGAPPTGGKRTLSRLGMVAQTQRSPLTLWMTIDRPSTELLPTSGNSASRMYLSTGEVMCSGARA